MEIPRVPQRQRGAAEPIRLEARLGGAHLGAGGGRQRHSPAETCPRGGGREHWRVTDKRPREGGLGSWGGRGGRGRGSYLQIKYQTDSKTRQRRGVRTSVTKGCPSAVPSGTLPAGKQLLRRTGVLQPAAPRFQGPGMGAPPPAAGGPHTQPPPRTQGGTRIHKACSVVGNSTRFIIQTPACEVVGAPHAQAAKAPGGAEKGVTTGLPVLLYTPLSSTRLGELDGKWIFSHPHSCNFIKGIWEGD